MIRTIALSALLVLSACDAPAPSAPASPPGVVLPGAAATLVPTQPRVVRETQSSTTTVSPDGHTTTRTTSSARVSVDPAAFLTALAGAGAPSAPPNRAVDFLGDWTVSNIQNQACQFTLHPPRGGGSGFVRKSGCTGAQMIAISQWWLRDGVVELANGFGGVQARLRVTAPNRLDGDGITMWR
jgi:hypothetical protein